MDTYVEFIIKKQRTLKDNLISAGVVLLAFLLCIYITPLAYFRFTGIIFLLPAIIFGIMFGAYKVITSRNIEFEYLLTGGDLDIDKIFNRSSRKRLISLRRRETEIIAPKGSVRLPAEDSVDKVIDATSGRTDAKVFGVVANKEGERILVYFEPTEKMMNQYDQKIHQKVFMD